MFDDMDDNWESKTRMSPEELEATTNYLKNHPLFIKEIPANLDDHPDLLALQNLIYDDTPENIARSFKDKGNEHFKKGAGKRYFIKQAVIAYTEGIDAGSSEKDVNAQLYNNRALMEMKLKNFGKAVDDCKKAIEFDPTLVKAHFRKAQIESMLRKFDQCLLSCLIGLEYESENKELLALKKESERQIEVERTRKDRIQQESAEQALTLQAECKKRRIHLGAKLLNFPESCRNSIFLDEKRVLHLPIFVHYPEFQQMDYIADSHEKDSLHEHLTEVLKNQLPWDDKHFYDINSIEVYIEFNQTKPLIRQENIQSWPSQQGFKKIDKSLTLTQIFSIRGYVLPQVPEITVVSTKSPFYSIFKDQYDFV